MPLKLLTVSLTTAYKSTDTRDWRRILGAIVLDRSSGTPLHVQLSNHLRGLIHNTLEDQEKLPPEAVIVTELRLALGTVRRAMLELVAEGLVERRSNHGTRVRKPSTATRLKHIAVIVPDFSSFAVSEILNSLHKQAQKIGAFTQLIRLYRGVDWKDLSHYVFFSPTEGGVLFCSNSPDVTVSLFRILSAQGYRTVNLGPYIEHYPGHYVGTSNSAAIELGLQKLVQLGHRRIALLVGEPEEFDEVKDRVRHFQVISLAMGLTEATVIRCATKVWENPVEMTTKRMPELWASSKRPTAIFAISDATAIGALFWLNYRAIRIPEEISILSFDGTELTRLVLPRVTSLVAPWAKIVEQGCEMLLSDSAKIQHATVLPQFAEGSTLAPSAV